MSSFFRLVWAVVIGVLLLSVGLLGIAYLKWGGGPSVEKHSVLTQPIAGAILEYPVEGFASGLLASNKPTLHGILGNLAKAAVDDRVEGVLLVLNNNRAGYGMLEEIRSGIEKVRDAGKPVWAWSDNFAFRDLYVASACDSFFVDPNAYIYLGGMYMEHMHVAGTLEKLGIEPEVHRIERYKSAAEMVTRRDMSPEAREMAEWLGNDIYPRVVAETARGFGVETSVLTRAMTVSLPLADELETMGLATGVRYWDEMKSALPREKSDGDPVLLSASNYAQIDPADLGQKGKKKIAVVHAQGIITGEESGIDPLWGVVMGFQSVNRDLKKALDDDDVVGVVFRVDSRGGESITSDRMSRMVEVVDREKPVVVSMVDVAASGGYTISYRGRTLVANSNTITGSIGSITGKFNMKGLYDKLGMTFDGVALGPNADFYSASRGWTEEEYRMMSEAHWAGYRHWIKDIASFRDMSPAEIDSLGRGRVWTGVQAKDNGLVDEIGNLDRAIQMVKAAAGIDDDEKVTVVHLPHPEGLLSSLLGMNLSQAPDALVGRWVGKHMESMQSMNRTRWSVLEVPVP